MRERPGPTPEELADPEQAEKDKIYNSTLRTVTNILLSHPQARIESSHGVEARHVTLLDVAGYGRAILARKTESHTAHSEGKLNAIFFEPKEDLPARDYGWSEDRKITYLEDNDLQNYKRDTDISERRELQALITQVENELQDRGEI